MTEHFEQVSVSQDRRYAGHGIDGMHTMHVARELTVTAADGASCFEIAGREPERVGIALRPRYKFGYEFIIDFNFRDWYMNATNERNRRRAQAPSHGYRINALQERFVPIRLMLTY